ncbi:uncharacterized protein G2W53_016226 [Senna tora]|uniref:Uncharacterized protein n=1 Tax=Senna tora TaxID=362788 RepID=A0A834TP03_9FABA|nr:uncharacterized protein G2W53_016226 [Senna tora]
MDGYLNGHNATFKPKAHGSNLLERRNFMYF